MHKTGMSSMKALLKKFSYVILCLLLSHGFSYAMTPEEFDQEMQVAIHSPRLPNTGIWKKLPRFLAKSHVRADILANLSEESRAVIDGRDLGRGLIGGALVGLGLFTLNIHEEPEKTFAHIIVGSINGGIVGAILGGCKNSSLLSEHPYLRETSKLLLSITAACGGFSLLLPGKFADSSLPWGGVLGIISYLSAGRERVPEYALLAEPDREAILTSYIYIKVPKLVQPLEDSEVPPPPVETIPQPLRVNAALPTAWAIYESGLRNLYVTSALNASELVYDLEDNLSLRSNTAELLNRMNADLQTPLWAGADTFNVVTGNYGRYKAGKDPVFFTGMYWKEKAALITWSRQGERPLILVSFKGTTFSCKADFTSAVWKVAPKPLGEGKVHSGFCDIADSCIRKFPGKPTLPEKIADICKKLNTAPDRVQILFTGHSMGAAVASISAVKLLASQNQVANDNNNVIVMNFAQPRVWHKKSVNKFQTLLGNDNLVRFVTADCKGREDFVTGYLETRDFFRYRHFGHKVLLTVDKDMIIKLNLANRIHDLEEYYREGWNNLQNTTP